MKKISLLGLSILAAMTATAQTALVKEVERNIKSKPGDYPGQVERLKPAFTNEETASQAYPYFVAGKGGYDYFDNQQVMESMGQNVDHSKMGHAVMDSYEYLIKALQRDTIVDAKGKKKTKYSKDIIKLINSHYNDFNAAAVYLWGIKDFKGAYDAWEYLFTVPANPLLGANAPKILPDSVISVHSFNQGLAAFNSEEYEKAIGAFDRAIKLGYTDKKPYDFAIASAYNMPDSVRNPIMAYYSELAYPLYGAEDNSYIGYIINDKMQSGKFNEAETMVNKYIAADPNNGQLYYILGVLYENKENDPAAEDLAIEQFRKCIAVDAKHAAGHNQLGYLLYRKAGKIEESSSKLSGAEFNTLKKNTIEPLVKEAAQYLEKSYELDPDNASNALANLRSIYYYLNDEENLKRIESLR